VVISSCGLPFLYQFLILYYSLSFGLVKNTAYSINGLHVSLFFIKEYEGIVIGKEYSLSNRLVKNTAYSIKGLYDSLFFIKEQMGLIKKVMSEVKTVVWKKK